jgi:hypothetical protein
MSFCQEISTANIQFIVIEKMFLKKKDITKRRTLQNMHIHQGVSGRVYFQPAAPSQSK